MRLTARPLVAHGRGLVHLGRLHWGRYGCPWGMDRHLGWNERLCPPHRGSRRAVPVPADALGCTQRVDVLPIVVGALLSFTLLATAGWLTRRRRGRLAGIVPFGAVAAVLAGLQPLMAVAWLVEQGNLTAGPIELAIGVVPLVWALVSAAVALTAWRPREAVFAP